MIAIPSAPAFYPRTTGPSPLTNLPNKQESLIASNDDKLQRKREAFDDFVGQTFYGQMLGALRSTVDKPAYFDGGRAEEVFQQQLDQVLAERLSDATAQQFTGPLFDLFNLQRPS